MKTLLWTAAAGLLIGALALSAVSAEPQAQADCAFINDIVFENGKIITVNGTDSVVSGLRIRGNKIATVGNNLGPIEGCTQRIDLRGRTVIPGLIDNHNHWVGRATRPGHHVPEMDSAFSMEQVLALLKAKAAAMPRFDSNTPGAQITADDFVTSIGGFDVAQFEENRFPTLEELDTVDHPVFLSMQFDGPAMTNTAGKRYFEARGITVGPATVPATPPVPSPRISVRTVTIPGAAAGTVRLAPGQIAQTRDALAARRALESETDLEDMKRGTLEAMIWSASVGLTMNVDEGGGSRDPYLALYNEGRALTRVRIAVSGNDAPVADAPAVVEPPERAVPNLANVARTAIPNFGNDMVRVHQMGESIAPMGDAYGLDPIPANYDEAVRVLAKYGWGLQQHSMSVVQMRNILTVWEDVNKQYRIANMRWSLAHVFDIGVPELDRLHAMGAGVALHSLKYTTHTYAPGVPPYRTAYNHPLPAGAGSDGGNVTTINPWNGLYFMTTGLNTAGQQVLGTGPEGQTVTRRQALEMYTRSNGWFSFDDRNLGSLEVGKLADLAVLSADYDTVPDKDLRRVKSVLTVVDGNIVYSDGALLTCMAADANKMWYRKNRDDRCVPQ